MPHEQGGREERCEDATREAHVLLEQQRTGSDRAADATQHDVGRLSRETRPKCDHDVGGRHERDDLDQEAESDVHGKVQTSSQ